MNPDKPAKRPPVSRLPAPVDHEVRRMEKPKMSGREREIRDECRKLAEIDWDKIADRLVKLYERDSHGTTIPDGRPTKTLNTDIPAADPEALTSTEAAVNATVFAGTGSKETGDRTGKLEPDPVRAAFTRARAALGQMALAFDPLIDNLNAGEEAQTWYRPIGQTAPTCKLDGCDQLKAKGKRGLCQNDYDVAIRWERKYGEPITLGEQLRRVEERNNPTTRERVMPS